MRRMLSGQHRWALPLAVLVAAGLAAVGIADASIPDSGGVIHGCYSLNGAGQTNGTQLDIVDPAKASCSKGQQPVQWSQTGPPGPKGEPGAPGAPGKDGVSVTSTNEPAGSNCAYGGVKFTSASGGSYACNGAPGAAGGGVTSLADLQGLSCTAPGDNGGPWGETAVTIAAPTAVPVADVTIACVAKEHDSGIPGHAYRNFHVLGTPGDESTYTGAMMFAAAASVVYPTLDNTFLGGCSTPGGAFVYGAQPNPAVEATASGGTAFVWSIAGAAAGHVHSDASGNIICPTTSDPTWN